MKLGDMTFKQIDEICKGKERKQDGSIGNAEEKFLCGQKKLCVQNCKKQNFTSQADLD